MTKINGILIAGQMYSGKSIAADFLENILLYKTFSFARSLKEMAADHYNAGKPISKSGAYPVYLKDTKLWVQMNGRDILIKLGEAIKNNFDYSWFYVEEASHIQDFFVSKLEADQPSDDIRGFIMDDNRFEEEYLYFRDKFNIKLVYIETNEKERIRRAVIRDGVTPSQGQLHSNTEKLSWAARYADIRIVNEFAGEKLFLLALQEKLLRLNA